MNRKRDKFGCGYVRISESMNTFDILDGNFMNGKGDEFGQRYAGISQFEQIISSVLTAARLHLIYDKKFIIYSNMH